MLFKSIYFRIVKDQKLKILAGLLILFILAGGILGIFVAKKLSNSETRGQFLTSHPNASKLLYMYRQFRKLGDIIYLPYFFKKDDIPVYELIIAPEDIKKMDDSLPDGVMPKIYLTSDYVYVPAEFRYQGKTYNVKVRYRGDSGLHWLYPKKSYLIKFDDPDPFQGMTRVSFIIVDDRKFALEHLNNYRAEKLGLKYPPSFFANLNINGKNHGLYFVIENWSREMLAKWGVPEQSNFYGERDLAGIYTGDESFGLWDNLFGWRFAVEDEKFTYPHFSELDQLLRLLHESSDKEFYAHIFDLVDKEMFYAWHVQRSLVNSVHQKDGNVRLLFDKSKDKFVFIPWDVSNNPLDDDNFDNYSKLSARIFLNPQFLHEKNVLFYKYAADGKNLEDDLAFYDETYRAMQPSLYKDRMKFYTNLSADRTHYAFRRELIENFERLKAKFENDGTILVNFRVGGKDARVLAEIDLNVEADADYYLKNVKIKFSDDSEMSHYQLFYDSNQNGLLDPQDRPLNDYKDVLIYTRRVVEPDGRFGKRVTRHQFFLASPQLTALEFAARIREPNIELENAITGKKAEKDNVALRIINEQAYKGL